MTDAPRPRRSGRLWLYLIISVLLLFGWIFAAFRFMPRQKANLVTWHDGAWDDVQRGPRDISGAALSPEGTLWLTNDDGLHRIDRYNGSTWRHYMVQEGDTLSSISDQFRLSERTIQRDNGLDDPDDLEIGQMLWLRRHQTYAVTHFGTALDTVGRRLVVTEGRLWLVTDDFLLWHPTTTGIDWHPLVQVGDGATIVEMTGGTLDDGSVVLWMLMTNGQLTRYDPDTDTLSSFDAALAPADPALAWLPDGTLYIVETEKRIRRLDTDGEFTTLLLPPTDASPELVGAAGGALWVTFEGELWRFAGEGEALPVEMLGIPANSAYLGVSAGTDGVWLATSTGVLHHAGAEWTRRYTPEDDPIRDVIAGQSGAVWIIVEREASGMWASFAFVGVGLVLGVAALALLVMVTLRLLRGGVSSQDMRGILEQGAGDLPKSMAAPAAWEQGWRGCLISGLPILLFLGTLAGIALVLGIESLNDLYRSLLDGLERIWPDAPEWAKDFYVDAVLSAVLFVIAFPFALFAILRTDDPEKRKALRRRLLFGGLFLLAYPAFMTVLEYGMDEAIKDGPQQLLGLLAVCGVFLAMLVVVGLLVGGVTGRSKKSLRSLLQAGDYEAVLANLERIPARAQQQVFVLGIKGAALMTAGRYAEAEPILRQAVAEGEHNPLYRSQVWNVLENLGTTLNGLGRYDEAIQALEAALKLNPNSGWAYARLAESYLLQSIEAERALELLETAQKKKARRPLGLMRDRFVFSEIAMDRAWALALLHRHNEATESMTLAWERAPSKHVPVLGGLHWRAGEVMRLRKDYKAAKRYYQQSLEIDPNGPFNGRAQISLDGLARDEQFGFRSE